MKISHPRVWLGLGCIAGLLGLAVPSAQAQNLADTIEKIKPSIVAIGTFQKTRRPPSIFRGTGFIVADGLHVVTNAHVLQEKIDTEKKETLTIFSGKSDRIEIREATKLVEDLDHDLVILKISGRPLTALTIGDSSRVREGETYAFTGFPIGMVRSECGDAQSHDLSGNASRNSTALRPATGQESLNPAYRAL
jgi:S1-C subfamily serine protease